MSDFPLENFNFDHNTCRVTARIESHHLCTHVGIIHELIAVDACVVDLHSKLLSDSHGL